MTSITQQQKPGIHLIKQNDPKIGDVEQGSSVASCKSEDVTPAPTPQLLRAIAFETAPAGTTVTPTPQPSPTPPAPRRDPVLIELGNIELNAKIQFISLSDDPAATFQKGDIYELPITGYDEDNRRATIALSAEMMEEKGITAGERLIIRQLDSNGNASDGIFCFLDPQGWAGRNMSVPNGQGGMVNARGDNLQYQVGLHNVQGANQLGIDPNKLNQTRQVMGLATRDTTPPKVIDKNVKVYTSEWTAKEKEIANHLLNSPGVQNAINRAFNGAITVDKMKTEITNVNTQFDPRSLGYFKELIDNPDMFARLDAAANGPPSKDGVIGIVDLQEVYSQPKTQFYAIEMALEPGCTGNVRNNRTGQQFSFSLGAEQRTAYIKMNGLENGDKLILEYADSMGLPGKPVDFEYSGTAKDGKKVLNPILTQVGNLVDDPLRPTMMVSGQKVKQMPASLFPGSNADVWVCPNKVIIVSGFASRYGQEAQRLGLPLKNEESTATGFVQQFENGSMTWDRASNQITVDIKTP